MSTVYASYMIVHDTTHCLLVRYRNRNWGFVGGRREAGETPYQTILREAREETTLRLIPNRLVRVPAPYVFFAPAGLRPNQSAHREEHTFYLYPCRELSLIRPVEPGLRLFVSPLTSLLSTPFPELRNYLQDYVVPLIR